MFLGLVEKLDSPCEPAEPGHVSGHVEAGDAHVSHVLHCGQGDVSPTSAAQAFAKLRPDYQIQAIEQNLPHFCHQSSENEILSSNCIKKTSLFDFQLFSTSLFDFPPDAPGV